MSSQAFNRSDSDETQTLFDDFYSLMKNALTIFFPLRKITVSNNDPPFVTPFIKHLLRSRNAKMRKGRVAEANTITENIRRQIIYENTKRYKDLSVSNPKKLWHVIQKECKKISDVSPTSNQSPSLSAKDLNDHYTLISTDS